MNIVKWILVLVLCIYNSFLTNGTVDGVLISVLASHGLLRIFDVLFDQ